LRVHDRSLELGRRLGLSPRRLKWLGLAAKLHDIGKVGLSEGILNKPTALSVEEYAHVREHPVIGERILAPIIRNPEVLAAIRHHHERFDGGGYPDGLRGHDIPYLARVIAVADCFDALTSQRAYRAPLSREAALTIMRKEAGKQFDPDMLPAFAEMIRAGSTTDLLIFPIRRPGLHG
jgi:HD-GYP domain-containing protein (c-di-GMP phosphodiesterase class II)